MPGISPIEMYRNLLSQDLRLRIQKSRPPLKHTAGKRSNQVGTLIMPKSPLSNQSWSFLQRSSNDSRNSIEINTPPDSPTLYEDLKKMYATTVKRDSEFSIPFSHCTKTDSYFSLVCGHGDSGVMMQRCPFPGCAYPNIDEDIDKESKSYWSDDSDDCIKASTGGESSPRMKEGLWGLRSRKSMAELRKHKERDAASVACPSIDKVSSIIRRKSFCSHSKIRLISAAASKGVQLDQLPSRPSSWRSQKKD